MPTATTTVAPPALGQALVEFSLHHVFPEDDRIASAALAADQLPAAIAVLADAQAQLEGEIHAIVEGTADHVRVWLAEARALQADMARRKTLMSDLLARSEAGEDGGSEAIPFVVEAEARARFLTDELNYNQQVRYLLAAVRNVHRLLDQAAQASRERRVLDALRLLETSWTALDAMPVSKACRALRLLDARAFAIKAEAHSVLDHVWGALVQADVERQTFCLAETREDEPMSLSDAAVALQAYKEVDSRMAQLWRQLDAAVVAPRLDPRPHVVRSVYVDRVRGLVGVADAASAAESLHSSRAPESLHSSHPPPESLHSSHPPPESLHSSRAVALLADLQTVLAFVAQRLPSDLLPPLSAAVMPDLLDRVINVWLAAAVPTALAEIPAFQATMAAAEQFCADLAALHFSGLGRLREWAENAPRVWLAKRREVALDDVRQWLSQGLGEPHEVERVERHLVSRSEEKGLEQAAADQGADWDTAWSDEAEKDEADGAPGGIEQTDDDGADAWAAWGDEGDEADDQATDTTEATRPPDTPSKDADWECSTTKDADWEWGDDGADEDPAEAATTTPKEQRQKHQDQAVQNANTATRQVVLREKYHISSLPEPVLALIRSTLDDGAALLSDDEDSKAAVSSVAAAAAGLFALPTLVLAMFRALAPYYYALDFGGHMFLYNDALYLAEQLAAVAAAWAAADRPPHKSPRARAMLRLDGEISKLQGFASRAYSREMALQKTVLRDLLGGDQNVLAGGRGAGGDAAADDNDAGDLVEAAVVRVRSLAAAWQDILAPSARLQAVGALAETLAAKLVADVLDMPGISQDEAFRLASLMARVTELDDLFVGVAAPGPHSASSPAAPAPIPMTSQYAPSWLRMQYLSEVLQSNLREVRYLWMESELSLYFSADEVVDLIRLSFEDNAKAREVAREIAQHPHPVEV